MKYAVLLCDGMADTPCGALGGKTPMEAAHKPAMDALAAEAEVGTVRTVPPNSSPGSDVANLSVMGYDPSECYTGRSPLEAANLGVDLREDDVALRCNLVTLSGEEDYPEKTMVDYCAGDIRTEPARRIVETLQRAFGGGAFDFYPGTAYRHCLVWHGGAKNLGHLIPPHDISGRVIGEYLPSSPEAVPLAEMMRQSFALLADHPVNAERRRDGLRPANAIWLWGNGTKPRLQSFYSRFGLKGAMISAVDLLKGIARLNGMTVYDVPGATGYIDTDFEGKTRAAMDALENGHDLIYLHFEAPDECGHRGEATNKVKAIEAIDSRVLSPLLRGMREMGDFAILIAPDHPTPLAVLTHTADPVPYLIYRSTRAEKGVTPFTEATAASTGIYLPRGTMLMERLLGKNG